MTNTIDELIQTLERLKAEIEWDYSLEYQIALDRVIKILKGYQDIQERKNG